MPCLERRVPKQNWSTTTRLQLMPQLNGIPGVSSCYDTMARLIIRCIYVLFRRVELERRLQGETLMSEERKISSFSNLGKKESTFLRLKRTKFGLDDFRTIKVIGKGAFGEVSFSSHLST